MMKVANSILRDDIHFSKLAWQAATNRNNNTYQWKDEDIQAHQSYYYRLKMVEEARFTYSKVVHVVPSNATTNIYLFPNPTNDKLYIERQGGEELALHLSLFDSYGRRVQEAILPVDQKNRMMDVAGLSKGVYWLEMRNDNYKENHKVVVY